MKIKQTKVEPLNVNDLKNKYGNYGHPVLEEIKEDLRRLRNAGVSDDRGEGDKDLLEVRKGRN